VISRNSITGAFPIKRLGEVVEFLDSKRRPVTESDRRAGPFPYYGANGIQGTIDEFIFDEPLVLLAEDGGHFGEPDRGIAYRISGKTWVNNHAHVLRPTSAIELAYLCRVLENYDVTPFVTGTTRGKLTKAGASEIVIPLPPLAEQRRIAEVLDRAEALRAKRRAALAQLDSLTQSLFLDLFGDPVSNPKGWPETTLLGDMADIVSGITKGRKLNGEKVREVPYLAVANVQDRALNLAAIKSIEATEKEIARYRLLPNDLVLTEGGDPDKLGRGTLWNAELSECIHQNHIFRVRLTSDRIAPLFANWLISGARGKRYFLKSAKQTTGIASINMTQLRGFPLLIPPITLQREFARRVTAVEALKTAQRASLGELDALFATLQHRAFRGEL
jgi:type I restriction enzyme, S subunit